MHPIPDFIISGAQKCGTTSLYYWLGEHPDVFLPRIKEPNYFSTFNPTPLVRRGIPVIRDYTQYEMLYHDAKIGQLCGDASVSYLWDQYAAHRIKAASPKCKVIILVRDPVDRAYSAYLMWKMSGFEKRTFEQAIKDELKTENKSWENDCLYVELGRYGYQAARYFKLFPREQILIVGSRELSFNPRETMASISTFLELDPNFWGTFNFKNFNIGGEPKNQISDRILGSNNIRAIGKLLVPRKFRPWLTEKMLIKKGTVNKPSISSRKIIWSECERDIKHLESLAQRKYADLWLSYPF